MTENQSQLEIRAVKLKRKGDEGFIPEIIVHDPEAKLNRTYSDCENLCHSDFTKAVSRLNHHIAVLTDKITTDRFEDDKDIDEIMVARGFSYSGAEMELRVTLKGYQKTSRGGTFQINTPVVYMETEDEDKQYYFIDDLKEKLKRIALEARLYIFSGKKFEDPQLSLTLPDPPDDKKKVTNAKIADPIGKVAAEIVAGVNGAKDSKKKGGKKRVAQTPENKSGEAEE
jgi:hypothetical protein